MWQKDSLFTIHISTYMGVQMFVCLLVCEGVMKIQTPSPIWMKFCTPHMFKEGSAQSPSGPGGPETRKGEEHIFENCL